MTLTPSTKLGPYEILAPIGAGGMGEVWKARDTRLGRIVAIKKVKEQHSERFKQEARSIAALNHPNICQLHDIGSDYLVLEYVEGKPLSSPLPEKEAVRLGIQIATALEAAHKKGIIHRDLKPANIMVTDEGSVKLLDFGLAKLYEQDASSLGLSTETSPATQTGAVLGTVAYMSPEQAQGQLADVRSDIFSFGLVLYEMLSGRRAFSGDSNYAIINAIVKEEPPLLLASPSLEKIVRRCLAKQPSGRYQTMSEVKGALEQVFAEKPVITTAEPQPSIAVLPFVNMSGDKEQEYFSDGLAEEIINALTQIPGLKVTARTSSFSFRGKDQDIRRIADALNVTNILEGSVRKAGNRVRITAQLIAAADGSHLWSQRYDREMTDVFAIQDEISQTITEKLRVRLSGDWQPIRRHTQNVEAYTLYLKGRHQLAKFTVESMAKCKEYLEQALTADPSYTLAWNGLAIYYWYLGFLGFVSPKETNLQCNRAVTKVLQLDETLAEAHSLKAMLLASEYSWKESELEFRRALELNPESSDVLANYGKFYLVPMRRFDEAIEVSRKALELDPLAPLQQWDLGLQYTLMEQYDRALHHFRNTLELDPQYQYAHLLIGMIQIWIGRVEDGIQACELAINLAGRSSSFDLALLGMAYALGSRTDDARRVLGQLHDLARHAYVSPTGIAYVYLALGEVDKCLDWVGKAIEERDFMIFHFVANPLHHILNDPLRYHPRYYALLRKMNLEP